MKTSVKHRLGAICCALLAALMLVGCTNASAETEVHKKYAAEFKSDGKGRPYELKTPLKQADLSVYDNVLTEPLAATLADSGELMLTLSFDLNYYSDPDASGTPALTLKSGTKICVFPDATNISQPLPYGLKCYPDYKAGWRYGRAFVTSNVSMDNLSQLKEQPLYYVKTADLKKIAEEYYEVNRELNTKRNLTKDHYVLSYLQFYDQPMYLKGIFCSPEFAGFADTDY